MLVITSRRYPRRSSATREAFCRKLRSSLVTKIRNKETKKNRRRPGTIAHPYNNKIQLMYMTAEIVFRTKYGNALSAIVTKHCVSLHTNSIISPTLIVVLLCINTCKKSIRFFISIASKKVERDKFHYRDILFQIHQDLFAG
jgi:hypothetical protein